MLSGKSASFKENKLQNFCGALPQAHFPTCHLLSFTHGIHLEMVVIVLLSTCAQVVYLQNLQFI